MPERVRHLKRGTEYEVLARGVRLQGDAHESDTLVLYRGADSQLWAREEGEFDDGRFEKIKGASLETSAVNPHVHTWIGDDCPEGWRRVGSIDVADPADTFTARDQGRRIGTVYDGCSGSVAEPCCADTYARTELGEQVDELQWKVGDLKEEAAFQAARFDCLLIAFHDAIRRPLGVTPDSGAEFYDLRMAEEAEARRRDGRRSA